jgi:hypothetical protein
MKMVKSLLLGTAAGLVAMTGAQAADLPVKAKPVQYVKICSLYGAGFYYIPGTDMCLKVGGWVRQYMTWNTNGSLTTGPLVLAENTRNTQTFAQRTRGYITADARNQTEYGTLRSYIAVGLSGNPDAPTGSPLFSANRGFIQLAGFTFGLSQSFYDFHATPAYSYFGGNINPSSDSGDGGKLVTAYTAQFGNGLSATISAEAQRNTPVYNANIAVATNAAITDSHLAMQWPDVIANLRVDQAWGSAQIMAAIHDASGKYYNTSTAIGAQDLGHPSDKIGFAIGAGAKFLLPMVAPGDVFSFQVNYTQGAGGFANNSAGQYSSYHGGLGGSYAYGLFTDGVYGGVLGTTATGVELTTTWGVNAAFEHFWSKRWQTSLYGAYVATSYGDLGNRMVCASTSTQGGFLNATLGSASTAAAGCDNNFAVWIVGSRTQWNIDSSTYIGVDVAYAGLKTASGGTRSVTGIGAQPTAIRTVEDTGEWLAQFRVHRNFYP